MTACGNCSTTLQGKYCHSCGQKDVDPTGTLKEFAHDAWHELAHVDGQLLMTLRWLVLRPGGLTREVLEGRRARYASPLRLYLTCSLLFFALTAMAPRSNGIITYRDTSRGATTEAERAELKALGERMQDRIARDIATHMPRAMFVLMPFFALLTWALYRRTFRHYMPHLFFSLHLHAFAFLLLAGTVALNFAGGWGEAAGAVLSLAAFPYFYASLRRVFGSSWGKSVMKGTAIGLVYFLAIAAVLAGITVYAVTEERALRKSSPPSSASGPGSR